MNYRWYLKDGYPQNENKKIKVFGTFICGGGSTMGYKLAGCTHLGGVEIDPKVANVYNVNHHPKYMFNEDIRTFVNRNDLPKELYELDILDGSPPCTSFSTAGHGKKKWGIEKKFSEGQSLQTLDDLYFEFIKLVDKLKPKIFITENVSGLTKGDSKSYLASICKAFDEVGYTFQVFLLNSANMGVPQSRKRCFIIGHKKEYKLPKLSFLFNEKHIPFKYVRTGVAGNPISDQMKSDLKYLTPKDTSMSDVRMRVHNKTSGFTLALLRDDTICPTILSSSYRSINTINNTQINDDEVKLISSFPLDYNSVDKNIWWLCGMSVPPLMSANITKEVLKQWKNIFK